MSAAAHLHERCACMARLTEFNCGDGAGPTANQPPENHMRFMKAALPLLEAAPHVERYSW